MSAAAGTRRQTVWPFAIVCAPTTGYGLAAAPDFLVERRQASVLSSTAGGSLNGSASLVQLVGADGGSFWLLYRMVPLSAKEVDQEGEVARSGSRIAPLVEGVVTLERPTGRLTAAYFDAVHELVRGSVRSYFLADNPRRPVDPLPGTTDLPDPADPAEGGEELPLTELEPRRTKELLHVVDVPLPPGGRSGATGPAPAPDPAGSAARDRAGPDLGGAGADPARRDPGVTRGPGPVAPAGTPGAPGVPGGFGRPALAVIGALSLLVLVLLVLLALK
ncbi:hypothetical protein ACWC5I_09270 [Kitasatospora sp. NPDC001574]